MSVSDLADVFSINPGACLYEHVFDNRLAPPIVVFAAATAIAALRVPLLQRGGQDNCNQLYG
jgi:hypothetical protein